MEREPPLNPLDCGVFVFLEPSLMDRVDTPVLSETLPAGPGGRGGSGDGP